MALHLGLQLNPPSPKHRILACSWTLHHLAAGPNQVQNRAAAAALVLFVPPTAPSDEVWRWWQVFWTLFKLQAVEGQISTQPGQLIMDWPVNSFHTDKAFNKGFVKLGLRSSSLHFSRQTVIIVNLECDYSKQFYQVYISHWKKNRQLHGAVLWRCKDNKKHK